MPLDRLQTALERVTAFTAIVAGYALLGLSIAICVEIVIRRFFGLSMQGVDEVGGYVLAGTCAFGFGFALICRAHTRIDIFTQRGPASLQAVLNVFSAALLAAIACFMAWWAYVTFARSFELGSTAPTPLATSTWIPQSVWLAGLVLFAIVAIFLTIRGIAAWSRGPEAVNAIIGPISLEQEIDAEIDHQAARAGQSGPGQDAASDRRDPRP